MLVYCLHLEQDLPIEICDTLKEVVLLIVAYFWLLGVRKKDKIDLKFNTKKIEILHQRTGFTIMIYLYIGTDDYCVFNRKLTIGERREFLEELNKWYDVGA